MKKPWLNKEAATHIYQSLYRFASALENGTATPEDVAKCLRQSADHVVIYAGDCEKSLKQQERVEAV